MKATERINERSSKISSLSSSEIVKLFIEEEALVTQALSKAQEQIAKAIDIVVESLKAGGRLFYIGAGTSGRLGVLDAAECPPTFGTDPDLVQGLIAGGNLALTQAIEGAEDDRLAAKEIVRSLLKAGDVLIGISASGSTPYVCAALETARELALRTIAIANNTGSEIFKLADHSICLETGPEIIAGSTRLKAASAQKLVLNMISSSTMIKLGKTRSNLMTGLKAKNTKLKQRALALVKDLGGCSEADAQRLLEETDYEIEEALKLLETSC